MTPTLAGEALSGRHTFPIREGVPRTLAGAGPSHWHLLADLISRTGCEHSVS